MISARSASSSRASAVVGISARRSGWRVFTLASARAERPSSTIRRVSAIAWLSPALTRESSTPGHSARCTEAGASGTTVTTRSCHTRSVTKGTSGAISRQSTSMVSCSVHRAPGSPLQNRRRERRTYQFDRSSTKPASRLPARCVSNSSSAAVTSRTSSVRADTSHRSSTWRPAGAGAVPTAGVQSFARAYRLWNATVLRKVISTLRTVSEMVWCPTLRDAHGEPPAAMNHRTASAPWVSISGIGSRMLPRCLLILRPSSARMWPRQSTLR